ncbi:MAG: sigma-70 family RNA polymerase sigma factor, partial [Oscillatoriales cyanobacterium]
ALLQKGYQTLESNLPQDIRAIYLDENLDYQQALV